MVWAHEQISGHDEGSHLADGDWQYDTEMCIPQTIYGQVT
jgi:hypothetical protein